MSLTFEALGVVPVAGAKLAFKVEFVGGTDITSWVGIYAP
jgi:hypothetical protein